VPERLANKSWGHWNSTPWNSARKHGKSQLQLLTDVEACIADQHLWFVAVSGVVATARHPLRFWRGSVRESVPARASEKGVAVGSEASQVPFEAETKSFGRRQVGMPSSARLLYAPPLVNFWVGFARGLQQRGFQGLSSSASTCKWC
jgi:hypothetical protein